jgi:hypothetical protein
LWDPQTKFIALAKPRIVLIENVPPRTYGDNPTESMYDKLEEEVRDMGYNCTKVNEFNLAEHGGLISRRRYMRGVPAFEFLVPVKDYHGFRDSLEPAYSVRHNYRCRLSAPRLEARQAKLASVLNVLVATDWEYTALDRKREGTSRQVWNGQPEGVSDLFFKATCAPTTYAAMVLKSIVDRAEMGSS